MPIHSLHSATPTADAAKLASELLQLLRQLLSVTPPEIVHLPLQEYCRNQFSDSASSELDFLQFSDLSMPLLTLLYANSSLLSTLLALLNAMPSPSSASEEKTQSSTDTSGISTLVQNLFCNFVHFLVAHCRDFSCFVQPVLHVLSSRQSTSPVSKPFTSLVAKLSAEFEKHNDSSLLTRFIREGGAKLIFECVVSSCRQSAPSDHLLGQSISKLGQRESLKSFQENSSWVNFLPVSSIKLTPNRSSVRDFKSSSLAEHPSRMSTFQHTYHPNETWLQMAITLPFPILLHALQLFLPLGMVQNGPASILVEVVRQTGPVPPTPIMPILSTTGLPCVRLELQQPLVVQRVILHLHRPLVADSLSLSHMHLLGLGYGSQPQSRDELHPAAATGEHPRLVEVKGQ